jgi:hypothetical protein
MNQHSVYSLVCALMLLFILQSCNQRKDIPVNEENVERNIISIKTAQRYTARYRSGVTDVSRRMSDRKFLIDSFNMPVAVNFNQDALALLLNQKDRKGAYASGVRMYFARNDSNHVTLVLVPYDAAGNDILNRLIAKDVAWLPGVTRAFAQTTDAQAVDNSLRCPTFCDQSNSGLGGTIEFPDLQ